MQLTRNRFGISRKALATGIAAALLISGVGAVSATASAKKPAKKPAAAKEIYDFYKPKCPKNATTLRIAQLHEGLPQCEGSVHRNPIQ